MSTISARARLTVALTVAAAAVLPVAVAAPAGAGTPSETGCAAAYTLLAVADLEAAGPYQLPRRLDEAGNADGWVCGKPFGAQPTANVCGPACDVPVFYNFYENSLTLSH